MPVPVIFDLDGTLVDSAPDIGRIGSVVLAAEGAAPLTLEETRRFVGAGAAIFVRRMSVARGLPLDEATQARLLAAFLDLYEGAVDLTVPMPGAVDALARLQAAGHPLGVCTNKPEAPARALLAHLDLARFFGCVVGGDTLPVRKPDPAPLARVVQARGGGPALYVGDSEIDAEAAARAGLPFALYTEGYRRAPLSELPHDHVFDHFDRLPGLLTTTSRSA